MVLLYAEFGTGLLDDGAPMRMTTKREAELSALLERDRSPGLGIAREFKEELDAVRGELDAWKDKWLKADKARERAEQLLSWYRARNPEPDGDRRGKQLYS